MNFNLVRNAHVDVTRLVGKKDKPIARIIVDGQFEHTFNTESRVSKHLEIVSEHDLAKRLTGGHYFFVENELVDFRDSHYDGFVHDNNMITNMFESLGVSTVDPRVRIKRNTISNKYLLGKRWHKDELELTGFGQGGQFSSELMFLWNPFVKYVSSVFMLTREICTNGMVGLVPFLNRKIPLINRWEEHLHIANRQIQNKIRSVVSTRLDDMSRERASVHELNQVYIHASKRHDEALEEGRIAEANRLDNIIDVCNPDRLLNVYNPIVIQDTRVGAQVPADLTTFDVYNIATELRSHTTESDKSTNHALDKLANKLLFDRHDLIGAAITNKPSLSAFSSPEQAFFGIH